MEAKFTPGPWEVRDDPGLVCDECQNEIFDAHAISQCGAYPACVATIQFGSSSEANANLIAATPEMYEALEKAWHDLVNVAEELTTGKNVSPPAYYLGRANDIDVLLAKARGEA